MVILDVIYVLHIKFIIFCINVSFLAGLEVYQEPYCPHSKGSLINFKTLFIFGIVFCKILQLISHFYQFHLNLVQKITQLAWMQASLEKTQNLKDIQIKSSFVVTTCFNNTLPDRLRLKQATSIMQVRACTQYLTNFIILTQGRYPESFVLISSLAKLKII